MQLMNLVMFHSPADGTQKLVLNSVTVTFKGNFNVELLVNNFLPVIQEHHGVVLSTWNFLI